MFRRAQSAAENGQCVVAEMAFHLANGSLRAAISRARSGAALGVFAAGIEGTSAAEAILGCRQRAREE